MAYAQTAAPVPPAATADAPLPEPAPAGMEDPVAEAKAAETKAAQLFRENRFTEAAELLRLAYDKQPRPILLFNAGQAFRKAEHAEEAKAMYEQFLAAAPEHALSAEARGYIKDMETLLSVQERAKQVAFALEEQLAATQTSQKQVARKLEEERQRSLQIQQDLLRTQAQLEHQKYVAHRRLVLGLSIGIPLLALAAGAIGLGGYFSARVHTTGGTITLGE
jgi:tetratricopeptide (TPR) repeat protein